MVVPGMGAIQGAWARSQAMANWDMVHCLRSAQARIRWGRGMLCFRASGVNCGRVDRRPVVKRLFSSMAPVRKPRPRGQ